MLSQYKSFAAGSTVSNLNKELVGSTFIGYPKIDEQIKIGKLLDKVEDLITLHQRELLYENIKCETKNHAFYLLLGTA